MQVHQCGACAMLIGVAFAVFGCSAPDSSKAFADGDKSFADGVFAGDVPWLVPYTLPFAGTARDAAYAKQIWQVALRYYETPYLSGSQNRGRIQTLFSASSSSRRVSVYGPDVYAGLSEASFTETGADALSLAEWSDAPETWNRARKLAALRFFKLGWWLIKLRQDDPKELSYDVILDALRRVPAPEVLLDRASNLAPPIFEEGAAETQRWDVYKDISVRVISTVDKLWLATTDGVSAEEMVGTVVGSQTRLEQFELLERFGPVAAAKRFGALHSAHLLLQDPAGVAGGQLSASLDAQGARRGADAALKKVARVLENIYRTLVRVSAKLQLTELDATRNTWVLVESLSELGNAADALYRLRSTTVLSPWNGGDILKPAHLERRLALLYRFLLLALGDRLVSADERIVQAPTP